MLFYVYMTATVNGMRECACVGARARVRECMRMYMVNYRLF